MLNCFSIGPLVVVLCFNREHCRAMSAHSNIPCHGPAADDDWASATVRLLVHLIHQSPQTSLSSPVVGTGSNQLLGSHFSFSAFRPGPSGLGGKLMSNSLWSGALQRAGRMMAELRELAGIWEEVEEEASKLKGLCKACTGGTLLETADPQDEGGLHAKLRIPDAMLLAAVNSASEEDNLCCLQCLSQLTCSVQRCRASCENGGVCCISEFESLLNLLIMSCYYARKYSHPGEVYSALGISLTSASQSKCSYTNQLGAVLAASRCRRFECCVRRLDETVPVFTTFGEIPSVARPWNLFALRLIMLQSCIATMTLSAWCLGLL
jgi:hypothetical protein